MIYGVESPSQDDFINLSIVQAKNFFWSEVIHPDGESNGTSTLPRTIGSLLNSPNMGPQRRVWLSQRLQRYVYVMIFDSEEYPIPSRRHL